MAEPPLARHLERPNFWGSLEEGGRTTLQRLGRHRRWNRGDPLTLLGSEESRGTVIVLRSGLAMVKTVDDKAVFRLYTGGDLVGYESGFLPPHYPQLQIVVAATRVHGITMPIERFTGFIDGAPGVSTLIHRIMADRLFEADFLRTTAAQDIRSRIAHGLYFLAERYGNADDAGRTVLALQQGDIARLLATSRETLVRVLRELREAGAIASTRGSLVITSFQKLAGFATSPDAWKLQEPAGSTAPSVTAPARSRKVRIVRKRQVPV